MTLLVFLVILFGLIGFILGGLIFGKETCGTLYFYTDSMDGKEYTFAQFDAQNIHDVDDQKTITLHCVKLPPDFELDKLSHPELRI